MRTSLKLSHSNVARPIEQFKHQVGELIMLDQLNVDHILWKTDEPGDEAIVARITCKQMCLILERHQHIDRKSGSNWYFVNAGHHSGWINECFMAL